MTVVLNESVCGVSRVPAQALEEVYLMFNFEKLFEKVNDPNLSSEPNGSGHDVRMATCVLLLEMAQTDGEFKDVEREKIFAILRDEYGLTDKEADEFAATAEDELKKSLDLWKFTNLINDNYSREEKVRVVELVWRIIYADGKLDQYEDYLIHKLAVLLDIQHDELISAKLRVLGRKGSGDRK